MTERGRMTIYAVACVNYSPPKVNSVWSDARIASIRKMELWAEDPHGVLKTFVEEVDSGTFKLKNELK